MTREAAAAAPIVVDPRWLLKAGLGLLAVAFLCGYVTLCLLFYQGQWQLVLHPVRTAARPAAIGGTGYEFLRFGPDGSGTPQRTAWWMQAGDADRYRHLVVLYLPSGDGSLESNVPVLEGLRRLGIAVFAIDYRGYGESADRHPSETAMREDAEAAWTYLIEEKKVSGGRVIPFGSGVGAALAMGLAEHHPEVPSVILDAPRFDLPAAVRADPRVRYLPVELLLHDRFALEPGLARSKEPKLIFSNGLAEAREVAAAGEPKMTVEMTQFNETLFAEALRRFLDAYAPPTPPAQLMMNGAPRPTK